MLETIWTALNSPLAITVVAGVVLWLLKRLYSSQPYWRRWEGAIISAVKHAEKLIPSTGADSSVKRLAAALAYVLRIIAEVEARQASEKEAASISEGIRITHAELEVSGALDPAENRGDE